MRMSRASLTLRYANRCHYFGLAALSMIVCLMFLPWFLIPLGRDFYLSVRGNTTQGKVVGKRQSSIDRPVPGVLVAETLFAHGGKRTYYSLAYEFTVDGKLYSGATGVSFERWNAARPGDPIDVVYLPSDPSVNRSGPVLWFSAMAIPIVIGSVAGVLSIRFLLRGIRDIRAKVRLIAEGAPALGVIDAVEIERARRRAEHVARLRYRFAFTSPGEERLISAVLDDPAQAQSYLPRDIKAGDVVLVIHDPADPNRHEIDRFDARRDDRERLQSVIAPPAPLE